MQPTSQSSDTPLILVVDDEPTVRKVISLMLQRAGYRIELAVNGLDALTKIRSLRPDLITLDHMMPDLTGEEVRAQILNDEEAGKILRKQK
jgi:CheY-like chemotaxis protein